MDKHQTHQPLLLACMYMTDGPVLELGCGNGSTLLLHSMCGVEKRKLVTLESDRKWLKEFTTLRRKWHKVEYTKGWLGLPEYKRHWGLVFVDHGVARLRGRTIDELDADVIVAHDSHREYNCRYAARFKRYKYRYDYKKLKPWTTTISNIIKLDGLKEMDL